MRVMIGFDPAEEEAAAVAWTSFRDVSIRNTVEFLRQDDLRARGLYTRVEDARGQRYDLTSRSTCSTEFSNSRFLAPILELTRWVLFTDCDVLFLEDPARMLNEIEPGKAVYVVKRQHAGTEPSKMMGMAQTQYPRKNWSSVMLFDCSHPANRRLSLWDVNNRPGRDLHAFYWLHDSEIGDLDRRWNQLIGVDENIRTDRGILHFSLGGPWFENWEPQPHDDLWLDAAKRLGVRS